MARSQRKRCNGELVTQGLVQVGDGDGDGSIRVLSGISTKCLACDVCIDTPIQSPIRSLQLNW